MRDSVRKAILKLKACIYEATELVEEIEEIGDIYAHHLPTPGYLREEHKGEVSYPVTVRDAYLVHEFFVLAGCYTLQLESKDVLLIQEEP